MTAPNPEGVRNCIRMAVRDAGIDPAEIDAVNGHLTATYAAPVEVANWSEALGRGPGDFPWIQSTKSMIGHCLGAAGAIECAAVALQLKGGVSAPVPELQTSSRIGAFGHGFPECVGTRISGSSPRPVRLGDVKQLSDIQKNGENGSMSEQVIFQNDRDSQALCKGSLALDGATAARISWRPEGQLGRLGTSHLCEDAFGITIETTSGRHPDHRRRGVVI
jgi:hypothetical protein